MNPAILMAALKIHHPQFYSVNSYADLQQHSYEADFWSTAGSKMGGYVNRTTFSFIWSGERPNLFYAGHSTIDVAEDSTASRSGLQ